MKFYEYNFKFIGMKIDFKGKKKKERKMVDDFLTCGLLLFQGQVWIMTVVKSKKQENAGWFLDLWAIKVVHH